VLGRCALVFALLLTTYASLRPFAWSAARGDPLVFLLHPKLASAGLWDFTLNVFGYMPLGFFGVFAVAQARRYRCALIVLLGCIAYSVLMETLQNYLPGRTPSAMDVIANTGGAVLGVLAGLFVSELLKGYGGLATVRDRLVQPGLAGAVGVVLMAAWLVGLLAPRTLLYASGDLRVILNVAPGPPLMRQTYAVIEAALAGMNLFGVALLLRLLLRHQAPFLPLFAGAVVCSFAARSIGFGMFWTAPAAFDWLTEGAKAGLVLGLALAPVARCLPRQAARVTATVVLAAAAVGVNLAPPDPATWRVPRPTRQQELAPVSAVARTTAALWPFAAIGWIVWPRSRLREAAAAPRREKAASHT